MQTIIVNWYGPYSIERFHLNSHYNKKGLYAISRVWGGKETLLYIGMTTRGIGQRFKEHQYWVQKYGGLIKIRFGEILLEENQRFSSKLLADVEKFLIILNEPCENTSNTKEYNGRPINIKNQGRRGLLEKYARWNDERLEDSTRVRQLHHITTG